VNGYGNRPALLGARRQSGRLLLDEVAGVKVLDRNRQDDSRSTCHVERDGGVAELGHDERVVGAEEQPQLGLLAHDPPRRNRRAVQVDAHVGSRGDGLACHGHVELLCRVSMRYYIIISYIFS
jgi:hypothetical protein